MNSLQKLQSNLTYWVLGEIPPHFIKTNNCWQGYLSSILYNRVESTHNIIKSVPLFSWNGYWVTLTHNWFFFAYKIEIRDFDVLFVFVGIQSCFVDKYT